MDSMIDRLKIIVKRLAITLIYRWARSFSDFLTQYMAF